MKLTPGRLIALNLLIAVIYFGAARLGLSLASVHTNVSPVWPPSGIAIGSVLIFGWRVWPAILAGAFAANLDTNVSALTALSIAIGNTLEAIVAMFLLRRRDYAARLDSVRAVAYFVFAAALVAPIVSASIGTLSLCISGAAEWSRIDSIWLTWWLGDSFGALILTPVLLAWKSGAQFRLRTLPELIFLTVSLFVSAMVIFGSWFPGPIKTYPLAYICLPILLWASLRLDQRAVTTGILLLASIAVWGASRGYGPFVRPNPNVSLLLLLSFVGTATLMTLVLYGLTQERARAEQEKQRLGDQLALHQRRVEDIVAHVPGVVWEAWGQPDASSQRINFVSSHVEHMVGYSEQEWLSTPNFWLSIVHPEDKERAAREAADIFNSRRGGTIRFRWIHKDGHEIWVESQSMVVTDESGEPVGMRGLTMDISPAVKAENERSELLQRESAARSQAEEASRLKDEFLATVSHELRTPLNAVVGWARLLRAGQLDQEGMIHALEVIERNAGTQKQIIEELLDVSRIITGKLLVNAAPVDLLLVIHAAIDVVRPAAYAKEIRILTHIDDPAVIVRGDMDRLQQVVWNLLSNAVKFTPQRGAIDVFLTRTGSDAEIRIEDSGPGIPVEFLPRVFDRFSQADGSSTRKHGGLGLGLAIVRHLVELHGGTVEAGNRDNNGGAVLSVRLPLTDRVTSELRLKNVPTAG